MPDKSLPNSLPSVVLPVAIALCVWGFGGEDPRFSGAALAVLLLSTAIWVLGRDFRIPESGLPRLRCLAPAAGLLALTALTFLFAVNRFSALTAFASAAAVSAAFLMVASAPPGTAIRIVSHAVIITGLFSVFGFLQLAGLLDRSFWYNDNFASRFVNSAHFGAMAAASMITAVGLAHHGGPIRRWCMMATIPVNAYALLLTQTRAVWVISLAVATAFAVAILVSRARGRVSHRRLIFAACLALALIVVGGTVLRSDIADRFAQLAKTDYQGIRQRMAIMKDTASLIVDNPAGVGAGCYEDAILMYKHDSDRNVANHAHNEILEVTAELGWAAVPLLVLFLIGLGRDVRKSLADPPLDAISSFALLAALGILFLHSLVDFPLRLQANSLLGASLLGALFNRGLTPAPSSLWSPQRAATATTGWVCAAMGVFSMLHAVSSAYADTGRQHLEALRLEAARQDLASAMRWMPLDPTVAYLRGNTAYAMSVIRPEPLKSDLRKEAMHALDRAVAIARTHADTHLRRAWLHDDLGRPDQAAESFLRAIECDPKRGFYQFQYAEHLLSMGRMPEAAAAYRKSLELFSDGDVPPAQAIFTKLIGATGNPSLAAMACPTNAGLQAALENAIRGMTPRTEMSK